MQEEWRDIKGYEGLYQVSNLGRVKTLPRKIKRRNRNKAVYKRIYLNRKSCQKRILYSYIE